MDLEEDKKRAHPVASCGPSRTAIVDRQAGEDSYDQFEKPSSSGIRTGES